MKTSLIVSAGLLAVALLSGPSFATGTQEQQQACTPDVFRLCGRFIPNEKQITACLVRNKKNLSPACKAVFSK